MTGACCRPAGYFPSSQAHAPSQRQLGWQAQASPQPQRSTLVPLQPHEAFSHPQDSCFDFSMVALPFEARSIACLRG
jgi:hypothetical protein